VRSRTVRVSEASNGTRPSALQAAFEFAVFGLDEALNSPPGFRALPHHRASILTRLTEGKISDVLGVAPGLWLRVFPAGPTLRQFIRALIGRAYIEVNSQDLANGTIERGTPALHDALYPAAAARSGARFARAIVNGKDFLKIAEFAISLPIIAQR